MRARIIAEFDDIQDQSDASAAGKKISLLDTLHLVAMSWKRVSEKTIENCFIKRDGIHHVALRYECWNFNSGNYLFTTDTK